MQGIDRAYGDICVKALVGSYDQVCESSIAEALLRVKYGKGDTLSFDAIPEITIMNRLKDFNRDAVLITEETDDKTSKLWPTDPNPRLQPAMFFSDPMDRSSFLKKFLETAASRLGSDRVKIGDVIAGGKGIKFWEETGGRPAAITGATSSITYVGMGKTVFSVIVNLITREIFIACETGIVRADLSARNGASAKCFGFEHLVSKGRKIVFPPAAQLCREPDDCSRFVTFLGKSTYPEHFAESKIIFTDDAEKFLHHKEPGGPSRILYLSDLQKNYGPVGFVLANGEKISEWIHWLPFVKFARDKDGNPALKIYETSFDRPRIKDGVLMATAKAYSIFNQEESGRHYLDVSRIKNFDRPSKFRSTIVVAPADNERITHCMTRHDYREISSCL